MVLQRSECTAELGKQWIRFENFVYECFLLFLTEVQKIELEISAQHPGSAAQEYLIKLCQLANPGLENGCVGFYHRANFELAKVTTTVKKLDNNSLIGVEFDIKFILPSINKFDQTFNVLSVPIPAKEIKNDNNEITYYYLAYKVPNLIGILSANHKAYSLDSCTTVPYLGYRYCSVDTVRANSDCATSLISKQIHSYCSSEIFSSSNDCLFTAKLSLKEVLVSYFNRFEILNRFISILL